MPTRRAISSAWRRTRARDGRIALASPIIPKRLVLGVGGRYVFGKKEKDEIINGFTLDLGGVLKITDGIFFGVSGTNLIDLCETDDSGACPEGAAPRTVGGGLSFGSSAGFQLSGDVRADFSPEGKTPRMIYAGGLEILRVQCPPGEDPEIAEEAQRRVAVEERDLHPGRGLRRADEDHGRGGAELGHGAHRAGPGGANQRSPGAYSGRP